MRSRRTSSSRLRSRRRASTCRRSSGNPFQPDVYFRGFDASPVSGTPQGLAVYQNGVRINEAFGDTVNWDLIPTAAVRSIDVISNNPGLRAQCARRRAEPADEGRLQLSGNRDRRHGRLLRTHAIFAAMGQTGRRLCRSMARSRCAQDNGYRDSFGLAHPSLLWRHRLPAATAPSSISTSGGADNLFGATAAAPAELLEQSWSSVYTTPQSSRNEVGYVNADGNDRAAPQTWTMQGALPIRSFYQIDRRRQLDQRRSLAPIRHLLCFNGTAPRQRSQRTAARRSVRAGRDARRDRPHDERRQRASAQPCPSHRYRQADRSRQSFRDRRQFRLRRHAFSARARSSDVIHPDLSSSSDRAFSSGPRAIPSRTVRSCCARPIFTRALCARHVRRHRCVFDFGRRPAECRQYPVADELGGALTATTPSRASIR